jgi:hypothetical protein
MQVALILSCAVAALIILKNGHSWDDIVKSDQNAMSSTVTPIFILLAASPGMNAVPNRPENCYLVVQIASRIE